MKNPTRLFRIICFFAFISFSFNSQAITYTSINPGAWNDVVSVWSTNGGASACGCTPGPNSGANTILVNHVLTVPYNIDINGGFLRINVAGHMTGTSDFTSSGATIDIFGRLTIRDYSQGAGSTVNMYPGSILMASGNFSVDGGTLNMDAALINSGKLYLAPGASMNVMNGSRYYMTSGNAVIDGTLTVGLGSCMESNGNWKIGTSGSVLGSGALNSGGNINNSGFVSPTISWCAQGAGLGMPSPEDCATAGTICNAVILPVRLTNFDAVVYENSHVEIVWETASENNNSHFILEVSKDGIEWTEIARVQGIGTSTQTNNYSFDDYKVTSGVTYYKLIQFDYDGKETSYNPISVLFKSMDAELHVYPNPVKNGSLLTIQTKEDGPGVVQLQNLSGRVVMTETIQSNNGSASIALTHLQPGIYLLMVDQNNAPKSTKLIIE